jgi:hypothetical protein
MNKATKNVWAIGTVVLSAAFVVACGGAPDSGATGMKDPTVAFGSVELAAKKNTAGPISKGNHSQRGLHGQAKGIVHHFPPPAEDACHVACDYLTAGGCGLATDCYAQICDVIAAGQCDAEFQAYAACAAGHEPPNCSVLGSYTSCETYTNDVATCVAGP